MSTPEEAGARARERAAAGRADGTYDAADPGELAASIADDLPGLDLLDEWAVIEVDPENVFSTRPLGAPITGFKRLLMRLMRQYTFELESRQTRFNIAMLAHFRELDERVRRLEQRER